MQKILLIISLILTLLILGMLILNKKEGYQPEKEKKLTLFSTKNIDPIRYTAFGDFGFTWKDLIKLYESGKEGIELANKISKTYFKVTVPQLQNLFSYSYAWDIQNSNPNWIKNYNYFVELMDILVGDTNKIYTHSVNLQPDMNLINLNNIPHKFLNDKENKQLNRLAQKNQINNDKYILFTYLSKTDPLTNKISKILTSIQVYLRQTEANKNTIEQLNKLFSKIFDDNDWNNLTGPSVSGADTQYLGKDLPPAQIYVFNFKMIISTSRDLLNIEWNKKFKKEEEDKKEDEKKEVEEKEEKEKEEKEKNEKIDISSVEYLLDLFKRLDNLTIEDKLNLITDKVLRRQLKEIVSYLKSENYPKFKDIFEKDARRLMFANIKNDLINQETINNLIGLFSS